MAGASSFAEDSPPLTRKGTAAAASKARHVADTSPKIAPVDAPRTPTPDMRAGSPGECGLESLCDSVTSVNFEESADAEEVMRMLEQGPPGTVYVWIDACVRV